jgi:hypothetical protein
LDSDPLIAAGSADLTVLEQRELGYMPKRGDFDLEEDNEAETLLNYLMIGAAETGLEAGLWNQYFTGTVQVGFMELL